MDEVQHRMTMTYISYQNIHLSNYERAFSDEISMAI